MPELGRELAKLRLIAAARQQAVMAGDGDHALDRSSAADQPTDQPASQLRVRCPECFVSTTVDAGSAWEDITCGSCGKNFSMIGVDLGGRGIRAGACVGHFELIEQVGFGAFGTVWKARDTDLDRLVAIKIPRRGHYDAAETEQFLREARAAAQLRHPNIVGVHEVGRLDDRVYIVSDLVEGDSLAETIADQRMSAREAAALCRDIALALDHAHAAGVVHRDLKPANILIDRDGQPHLTDFGLARRSAVETTVTHDGQLVGTPAYMSPEQARGQSYQADQRSDIYSLGVILYELLTGELPFRGNVRMVVQQILADDAANPRKLNATVPRDLETISLKCLEKDPARRYATARELADDLRRYLHGEPILARPISHVERSWRWCRRNPRLAGLSASVAALLLIVASVTTYSSIRSRAAAREARWQQYLSDMHVAMQAWDEGDASRAAELLSRHLPADGEEDLRHFEWYYLWRHVHAALVVPGFKLDSQARAVAVSPDGRLFATGDENGELAVWNLADLNRVWVREAHRFRIGTIDFTRDGSIMATGSSDQTARIWHVASGRLLHTLQGHSADVNSVAFSPDGNRLATASADQTAKLWDVATGVELCTLHGHTQFFGSVAWRNDGSIITGSTDQTLREWSAADGSQVRVVATLPVSAYKFALSPNQSRLAIGALDGTIRLLDANTGNLLQTLPGHRGRVRAVAFSADGQTLASGGDDRRALVWDMESGQLRQSIAANSSAMTSLAFTPDGARVITASQDGSVKLCDISSRTFADDLVCRGHEHGVCHVAFDAQGKRFATTSADGTVRLWNAVTGEIERVITHKPAAVDVGDPRTNAHWMQKVVWSPRGSTVFASGNDGSVSAWDVVTGDLVWTVAAHTTWGWDVDCSPDGQVIASCGFGDKVVRLWRATDGTTLGSFSLERAAPQCVKFSPDGRLLACGDQECRLVILDATTGEQKRLLAGHNDRIDSLAFSRDGNLVATCGGAPGAILWDLSSGHPLHTLPHSEHVQGVTFSPDGKIVATAGFDNVVRLWDVATGAERAAFKGHTAWVESLDFSPDGRTLASCSDDQTVRLWCTASRQEADATAAK